MVGPGWYGGCSWWLLLVGCWWPVLEGNGGSVAVDRVRIFSFKLLAWPNRSSGLGPLGVGLAQ